MHWVASYWGVVLVLGYALGAVSTVLAIRIRVRKLRGRLQQLVADGVISWGAMARQVAVRRRKRFSGVLVLTAGGLVDWRPDNDSVRRGAVPQSWPSASLVEGDDRRDITGVTITRVDLLDGHRTIAAFNVYATAGRLEREPR